MLRWIIENWLAILVGAAVASPIATTLAYKGNFRERRRLRSRRRRIEALGRELEGARVRSINPTGIVEVAAGSSPGLKYIMGKFRERWRFQHVPESRNLGEIVLENATNDIYSTRVYRFYRRFHPDSPAQLTGFTDLPVPEDIAEDELPERAGEEVFVRVHYATDRTLTGRTGPNHYYGSERGDLRYGQAVVSIPADHTMGGMERPTIWRIEFRENPGSHVVLRDIREMDHTQFFDELYSEIELTKGSAAFVFIHGFNVTFAAAARRAAQMAYDLFLIGQQRGLATLSTVPILYSWPSKGGLLGAGDYFHDAADSEASGGGHLKAFLNDVATLSGATSITIVAHSMGSRALTTALSHIGLGMPPGAKPLVKEIILAAPDVDRDAFLNVSNAVTRTGQRTTLYASDRDRALKASKAANGFPRLGDATGGVTVFAGGESIDASVVGEDILVHSYYGETSVLGDLYYLISQGAPPDYRFGLLAQGTPPNNHWIMRART